ncbi:MAG: DUF4430 domain-containing protein [Planctomycetota bacterium]
MRSTPAVLLILLVVLGCGSSSTVAPDVDAEAASKETGDVHLVFRFPEADAIEVDVSDVETGATLESVMRRLDLPIEMSGSGTTAFVQSINGKSMDSNKGWTFTVDGEFASQGIGSTTLTPPTEVIWSFGGFEADDE